MNPFQVAYAILGWLVTVILVTAILFFLVIIIGVAFALAEKALVGAYLRRKRRKDRRINPTKPGASADFLARSYRMAKAYAETRGDRATHALVSEAYVAGARWAWALAGAEQNALHAVRMALPQDHHRFYRQPKGAESWLERLEALAREGEITQDECDSLVLVLTQLCVIEYGELAEFKRRHHSSRELTAIFAETGLDSLLPEKEG